MRKTWANGWECKPVAVLRNGDSSLHCFRSTGFVMENSCLLCICCLWCFLFVVHLRIHFPHFFRFLFCVRRKLCMLHCNLRFFMLLIHSYTLGNHAIHSQACKDDTAMGSMSALRHRLKYCVCMGRVHRGTEAWRGSIWLSSNQHTHCFYHKRSSRKGV